MASIFISYRREEAAGFAGRLADELARRFGSDEVFRDVEDIVSGEDFVERLERALHDCRVLIALVDRTWLPAGDAGHSRLDDPRDFVRAEIARALARGVRVIPVLVGGAAMPAEEQLPHELKPFARRQAHPLSDSRWDYDVERLAAVVAEARAGEAAAGQSRVGSPQRRRLARLAAAAILIAIAAAAAWQAFFDRPDLNGTWDLPDGGYWIIRHAGPAIEIDVVHQDSRQVWQRGRGSVQDDRLSFRLDVVYQAGVIITGELGIDRGGKLLSGEAVRSPSGIRTRIILRRR